MTFSKTNFRKPLHDASSIACNWLYACNTNDFGLSQQLKAVLMQWDGNRMVVHSTSEALLPDITPGIPKHLNIHNQQQNEFLRFTNVWANVGEGALEFEEGEVQGETQQAFQNLYDDAGNFGDITEIHLP